MKRLCVSFMAGFVMPLTLLSQDSSKVHFIRASGEASVKAEPDRAEISVGVVTQAASAEAASAQNAAHAQSVLNSLKTMMHGHGEIRTVGYGVVPQYDYGNGHAPRLNGYEASNTVLVTLDDIALVSKAIDDATRSGANNISNIELTVRDRSALYAEALTEATRKARANAETIAKALGVSIVGVLQAEPQEPQIIGPRPMAAGSVERMRIAATPVETGTVELRASVAVSFEVR